MPLSAVLDMFGKPKNLPSSVLDLLSKTSYWPQILAHKTRDYSEYVAALTSLASFGAYEDNGGDVLKGLLVQRLELDPSQVEVAAIHVSTPALFVDTNAYVITLSPPASNTGQDTLIIVAFRGTEFAGRNFLVDVLTDARAVPVEFPLRSGNFVHGGFLTAADLVWSQLIETLVSEKEVPDCMRALAKALAEDAPSTRLYVTGHSLGGAIGVLAAARLLYPPERAPAGLERLRNNLHGVYTFGQPMVGGKGFMNFADQHLSPLTFRHVYQNDWVPHLPPRTTGGYRHFGEERRAALGKAFSPVDEKTGQAVTASISGLFAVLPFLFRAVQVLNKIAFPFSLEDHQPENYWRSCEVRV